MQRKHFRFKKNRLKSFKKDYHPNQFSFHRPKRLSSKRSNSTLNQFFSIYLQISSKIWKNCVDVPNTKHVFMKRKIYHKKFIKNLSKRLVRLASPNKSSFQVLKRCLSKNNTLSPCFILFKCPGGEDEREADGAQLGAG